MSEWMSIGLDEHVSRADYNASCEAGAARLASITTTFLHPLKHQELESEGADVEGAASPRRCLGCSDDDLTFQVPGEVDGEASQELVGAEDGAMATAPLQKKKRRSITFSSEIETSTFEVHKHMTPTSDMCDEVLLELQDFEKQNEKPDTILEREYHEELEESRRSAADEEPPRSAADLLQDSNDAGKSNVKSSHKLATTAKQVSFQVEPEISSYQVAEDCDADVGDENVGFLICDSAASSKKLQFRMKDSSITEVSPFAPYLLAMRHVVGGFVTVSDERGRTSIPTEHPDGHVSSVAKALDLSWGLLVESKLPWV
eukprot:CAMPEP_0169211460 /NCGR_PEP_ID=MMETSP1016-20121227/15763_1 /TAXON_ID=342587 /ORGANISM="Karlodinium micrum, Strain CCMP2283" /LENGTH=315 /DNA_ID=CAMNT_0009289075 /DNA_START=140 /DNA_END=1087 /DNA_ORIENTATION=-